MKIYILLTTVVLWWVKHVAWNSAEDFNTANRANASQNQTVHHLLTLVSIRLQEIPTIYQPVEEISNFPWIVSVQSTEFRGHVCSANILTNLYILTTCHCVSRVTGSKMSPVLTNRPEEFFVIAGLKNLQRPDRVQGELGQTRNVVQIRRHPDCTPSFDFDYGVLELEYYLYFTPAVQPMPRHVQDHADECLSPRWLPVSKWFMGYEQVEDLVPSRSVILDSGNCTQGDSSVWSADFLCVRDSSGELFSRANRNTGGGILCNGGVPAILSHQEAMNGNAVYARIERAATFLAPFYAESENTPPKSYTRYNRSNALTQM
ncbi:Tryp_SPc [Nesidiocoris tenuis]|uniref:Tryp_SPc n=1 Tax=Nesidiocoris tenuis TaxID=355587 RepID=A0ABN7ANR6_9HEMI|nr:Tryp_SPc [Nesidiocoris tenuis]